MHASLVYLFFSSHELFLRLSYNLMKDCFLGFVLYSLGDKAVKAFYDERQKYNYNTTQHIMGTGK